MTDRLIRRAAFGWAALMAAGAWVALAYVQAEFGGGAQSIVAAAAVAAAAIALIAVLARLPAMAILSVAVGLSLLVRLAAAIWARDVEMANDPQSYLLVSQWLLDGAPADAPVPLAYYPPLYPYLLAGVRLFLPDPTAAVPLLNAIIDGLGALLLFRLGARLVGSAGAAIASAAWLLWPPLLAGAAVAQKEGLSVTLFLALTLALVRWTESGRARDALLCGLAWGLMALAQPGLVLLPLFLFAAVAAIGAASLRATIAGLLLAIAGACLAMSPWWIRNFMVFGAFVPLTTAGGLAFTRLVPDEVYALSQSDRLLSEPARSGALIRQAVGWIADHPLQYVTNVVIRAGRGLLLDIGAVQQYLWFRPAPPASAIAALMNVCQLASAALWSAAALSLRLRPPTGGRLLPALLFATAAHVLLVSIWVQFYDRHRQVLTPLAMLCAAAAVAPRLNGTGRESGAGARSAA